MIVADPRVFDDEATYMSAEFSAIFGPNIYCPRCGVWVPRTSGRGHVIRRNLANSGTDIYCAIPGWLARIGRRVFVARTHWWVIQDWLPEPFTVVVIALALVAWPAAAVVTGWPKREVVQMPRSEGR